MISRQDAITDLIRFFCRADPPFPIIVEALSKLPEEQHFELQGFIVDRVRPPWLTGIHVMEAIDLLVEGAEENANLTSIATWSRALFEPPMLFHVGDAVRVRIKNKHYVGLCVSRGKKCELRTRTGVMFFSKGDVVDVLSKDGAR